MAACAIEIWSIRTTIDLVREILHSDRTAHPTGCQDVDASVQNKHRLSAPQPETMISKI
jgi:hypothetical protein